MPKRGTTMYVISHTHWDREWYMSFERFRHRLVHLMDRLLDLLDRDPDFRCFHLDAQTIVLEDYLEIRPENRDRLARYIREGRLHIGPWYVQNDEFLASGEATIRNLLRGTRIAAEFGCSEWVGYVPDQFGHLSQLPAIFRGFGIDTALLGRGRVLQQGEPVEFQWIGSDGSRVLAVFMPLWYNNAQRLPSDPRKLRALLTFLYERLAPVTPSGQLLLMNGVDHLEPQENLTEILRSIPRSWRLPRVVHSRLPDYFARVKRRTRNPPHIHGELREGPDAMILNGTLSSRPYLKQANQRCELLLERYLEPFALFTDELNLLPWPGGRLDYLWKNLIQNHPHDSICGCSTDVVHQDNMNRFRRVEELADDVLAERFEALALGATIPNAAPEDYKLVVFNPSPFPRSETVHADVDLLEIDSPCPPLLLDETGRRVAYRIAAEKRFNKRFISPINLPGAKPVRRVTMLFRAENIPPLGYRTFLVKAGTRGARLVPEHQPPEERSLENQFLHVRVKKDGSLVVTDKRTGRTWPGLNFFVDEGDAGDLYNFRPVENDVPISTRGRKARVRRLECNALRHVVEITWRLDLPCAMNFARHRRRRKTRACTIRSRVILNRGEPFVRIETTIRNRSRDHRLRVHFQAPHGATTAAADCPFDVVERPAAAPPEWNRQVNVNPMRTFAAVSDGEAGLAVFARGIYAQELTPDGTLALTLLRCTGRISANDANCPTEGQATEDSQLLGRHTFKYAIMPFAGRALDARLPAAAETFVLPLRAIHVPVDPKRLEGGRPWAPEDRMEYAWRERPGAAASLPGTQSFLQITNRHVVLSAVKKAEERNSVLVRLYNPTDRPRVCSLRVAGRVQQCWTCRLDEQRIRPHTPAANTVRLSLRPKQIVTLELELGHTGTTPASGPSRAEAN